MGRGAGLEAGRGAKVVGRRIDRLAASQPRQHSGGRRRGGRPMFPRIRRTVARAPGVGARAPRPPRPHELPVGAAGRTSPEKRGPDRPPVIGLCVADDGCRPHEGRRDLHCGPSHCSGAASQAQGHDSRERNGRGGSRNERRSLSSSRGAALTSVRFEWRSRPDGCTRRDPFAGMPGPSSASFGHAFVVGAGSRQHLTSSSATRAVTSRGAAGRDLVGLKVTFSGHQRRYPVLRGRPPRYTTVMTFAVTIGQ